MKLGNYKIEVTTEAESKEAQELFFALGYDWHLREKQYVSIGNNTFITAYPDEMILRMGSGGDTKKELSIPQLRDLAVLHRNDVSDANHIKNDGEMFGYLSSDNVEYTWNFIKNNWFKSSIYFSDSGIKPINQALISGADALRALADGREVEVRFKENIGAGWYSSDTLKRMSIEKIINGNIELRLKPQTITLNIEIPAPFEPKDGELFWFVSPYTYSGYDSIKFTGDCTGFMLNGVWRTEDEIKQVVAALRGALKNG
ncbi:MAG: hypothetical protein RR282_00690 [Acinetobacter sp.]